MTAKRAVSLNKLTLRVPRGADPQAALRAVTQALADVATHSSNHLRVSLPPSSPGEGPQALAHRIGRATAARLTSGDGS